MNVVTAYSSAHVSGWLNAEPSAITFSNLSGLSTNRFFKSTESKYSVVLFRVANLTSDVFSHTIVSTNALSSFPMSPRLLRMNSDRLCCSELNFSWSDCRNDGSFVNNRCNAELSLLHCLHRTEYFVCLVHPVHSVLYVALLI